MIPSLSAAAMISTHAPQPAVSGVLVSVESLGALPLTAVSATATCAAGIARVVLRQRFANDSALPLEVTYSLPLPAEAAVSGFAFTLGERRVVGEVDRRASARSRYEHALATGHTASLDRSHVSRSRSLTGMPASPSCRTPTIWGSVSRDFFMAFLLRRRSLASSCLPGGEAYGGGE